MLIKVCGITRQEDADVLERLGVDLCGFVFAPASPRYLAPEQAACIRTQRCRRVGVFMTQDPNEIKRTMEVAGLDFAQLHNGQSDEVCEAIGADRVIRVYFPAQQTVHPSHAAFALLDTGCGCGKTFDWRVLQEFKSPIPYFVAGGLNAANIGTLFEHCRPDGIDLNSGVELSPGIKSETLIAEVKGLV